MRAELKLQLKRLLAPLLRFSRTEIIAILALAMQPFVLIFLGLVIAAIEYPWLVLVWLLQLIALLVWAAVLARRRLPNRTENRHNPQVNGFLAEGLLDDPVESGSLLQAPDAQRRSINRLLQHASHDQLIAYAVHAGTRELADAVALKATAGALGLDGLLALASLDADARTRSLGTVDADLLSALARFAAVHDLGAGALDALLDLAVGVAPRASDAARVRLAELCVGNGRLGDAAAVLDRVTTESWQRRLLLADLVNPFIDEATAADEAHLDAWLALANASFHAAGLEPVSFGPGEGSPFDRLAATAPVGITGGPLVTVIMSAYKPDEQVVHAVRSIIDQTWRDWELLVMDDASGPQFDDIFASLEALDDRVRVVRNDVNAGTYVRRNDALALAQGDFVTMQDSDDWSHPRRLELQVRHLQAHPNVPANLTSALRVTSDLRFTQGRGLYLRLAEPSLMFRRQSVVDRIGFFDTARKSGDSEYRLRISRAFGVELPHLMTRGPLMLMRFDAGSLSGSDLADGWTHPSRVSYRSAYRRWHDATPAGGTGLRLPSSATAGETAQPRPFVAPPLITGESRNRGRVDTLLVLDARKGMTLDAHRAAVQGFLRAERAAGRRTGIMHAPAFRAGAQELAYADLLHSAVHAADAIEVAARDEEVDAAVTVVWGDGCLLGLDERPGVRTNRVMLVDGGPGADALVTAGFAEQLAQRRFGSAAQRITVDHLRSLSRAEASTDA